MNSVGGFLGLETGQGGAGPYHTAPALRTGRSCLGVILGIVRPERVHVPFYVCDALLEPIGAAGIAVHFYGIDRRLRPLFPVEETGPDELFVHVDYFGLHSDRANEIAARLGVRSVVDDSQAFFRRPRADTWSFNSARKFFGVPDGAYLHGPVGDALDGVAPAPEPSIEHLVNRRDGDQELAYEQYVEFETGLDAEPHHISDVSSRLLAEVDYRGVAARRRANFLVLHEMLGAGNELSVELGSDEVPCYYPYLAGRPLRDELIRRRVFVPCFWDEVRTRPGPGFEWERELAARLCPLPIDHRYDARVMRTVADDVLAAQAK